MSPNRLFIAAAGSGKTSLIINEVIAHTTEKILITTFTLENLASIRSKLVAKNNGCMPPNITIQSWFSFLIEHGIRPYRFWDKPVSGMKLVNETSAIKYKTNRGPVYWDEENNFYKHYFNKSMAIYSDKLSKLVFRCNKTSNGYVIKRLENIFSHIYIDEIQDMAGWDLDILKLLLQSKTKLTMVGDSRQTVYETHPDRKYKKYSQGKIKEFILKECKKTLCVIDESSLSQSYRNHSSICSLANKLFPDTSLCSSVLDSINTHTGIFFVRRSFAKKYYDIFKPMQLRHRRDSQICIDAPVLNFGVSKGTEYHHVLIYPTQPMYKWICNESNELKPVSRSQLYVAITRAFFSVAFIVDDDFNQNIPGILIW